ncbi:sucrose phosphorylase [Escherichia coli]|nr:sucrose phosphorylase [Escherichia coli]
MRDHSTRHLWTTFSDDQIDLNYRSPEVLLAMVDVLLCYLAKGAEYVRLDAVGFMWKEPGTSCIHLEKTHLIIKLLRSIIDNVAPGTVIITETNVPHKDNIVDSIGQRNSYVKTWGCGGFLNETNIYSRGKSLCF